MRLTSKDVIQIILTAIFIVLAMNFGYYMGQKDAKQAHEQNSQ